MSSSNRKVVIQTPGDINHGHIYVGVHPGSEITNIATLINVVDSGRDVIRSDEDLSDRMDRVARDKLLSELTFIDNITLRTMTVGELLSLNSNNILYVANRLDIVAVECRPKAVEG